jgi:hypothetical protein
LNLNTHSKTAPARGKYSVSKYIIALPYNRNGLISSPKSLLSFSFPQIAYFEAKTTPQE